MTGLTPREAVELAALERLGAAIEPVSAYIARLTPKYAPLPDHLDLVAAVLDAARDEPICATISQPPRAGKTETLAHGLAHRITYDPACLNFYATFGDGLAKQTSRRVRRLVRRSGVPLSEEAQDVHDWRTVLDGGLKATSHGGDITGRGSNGGLAIADDLIKGRKWAESKLNRDTVWDWFRDDFMSREEPGCSFIVNMTRWHDDDIIGRLIADGLGYRWIHLVIPAMVDAAGTAIDERKQPADAHSFWPKVFPLDRLRRIRMRGEYGWWCTPAETPILMEDWTCKRIEDVRPGDRVIGFKRGVKAGGRRAHLEVSTVLRTFSKRDVVNDLKMSSGRTVRCTGDHRWYTGRKDGSDAKNGARGRQEYAPARVGSDLLFACSPSDECTAEELLHWMYFAGIVDGEGHCGRTLTIAQSPEANPEVYDRIKIVMGVLGISYNERRRPRTAKRWKEEGTFQVRSTRDVYRKLIRLTMSAKKSQMARRLTGMGGRFITERDRVLEIIPGKEEPVFALETTTGNYIAWGYASSNSLYQQKPVPRGGGIFKRDDFRFCDERPAGGRWVRRWDLAASEDANAAFTAGVLVGLVDGTLFVGNVKRGQWSPTMRDMQILKTAREDGPGVEVWLPQDPGQAGLSQRPHYGKLLQGFTVQFERESVAKEIRWDPYRSQVGAHNVYLVRGPWNGAFLDEHELAPSGRVKDQIDAMAGAYYALIWVPEDAGDVGGYVFDGQGAPVGPAAAETAGAAGTSGYVFTRA